MYRISFFLSCLRPTLGSRVVSCFSRPATKRDLSSVLYAYWFLGFFFPCLAFTFLVYHLALVSKPFFFSSFVYSPGPFFLFWPCFRPVLMIALEKKCLLRVCQVLLKSSQVGQVNRSISYRDSLSPFPFARYFFLFTIVDDCS